MLESNQIKANREKRAEKKSRASVPCGKNTNQSNLYILEVSGGKQREIRAEVFQKVMISKCDEKYQSIDPRISTILNKRNTIRRQNKDMFI